VPNDADALFFAAWAAHQLGNREQARGYLDRLAAVEGASPRRLWLEARTLLRDAVADEAPAPQLVLAAQSALVRLGRAEEALELVRRARAARPQSDALLGAEAQLALGIGDAAGAETLAAELAARDPGSVDALLVRARIKAEQGAADNALLVAVRQARARAPQDIRLPVMQGILHGARGETEPACTALVDALRLDPTTDEVIARLRGLGCAEATPGLLEAAHRDLMATHPDAVKALPALIALGAGAAGADGGLAQLRSALDADSANAELRAGLALALMQQGGLAEAAALPDSAPPEQLGVPAILRATGVLALAREDAAGVVRALTDLLSAKPGTAEAAYLLADAEARAGELSSARYHLTEGLRLDPVHAPPTSPRHASSRPMTACRRAASSSTTSSGRPPTRRWCPRCKRRRSSTPAVRTRPRSCWERCTRPVRISPCCSHGCWPP
jgi:thioredoxin-like negative regulator of GroEL